MDSPQISNVELFVTENCNLSCKYCFHTKHAKNMSDSTLDKTLEFLTPYFADNCDFSFFGGEPLLRQDFILRSAEKIKARFPKSLFFLSTNATMYSAEIVNLMNSSNSNTLQISYDGLDQATLRGEQETVVENIKKYVATVEKNTLTFRMTYTPETVCHLSENIEHMYNLGCRSVMHGAEFSERWTEASLAEYKQQLNKIYDFIKDKYGFKVVFADCKAIRKSRKDAGCKMGKQMLAISAEGNIYPCHRAVSHREFKLGSVHENRMNRGMFLDLKMDDCSTCKANGTCAACFIANYEYSKSLKTPMDCTCSINLIQYAKAVEVYNENFSGEDAIKKSMINVLEDILSTSKQSLELLKV